jgi:hypothetical protein
VIASLVLVLVVGSFGLAASALLWAALDRRVRLGHVVAGGLLELLILVQAAVAVIRLIGGTRPAAVPTFVGYLLGSLIVLPFGVLWALEERTRWSSVVLAIAGVTVAVILLRMNVVWDTRAPGG